MLVYDAPFDQLDLTFNNQYSQVDAKNAIAIFKLIIEESLFSTVVPSTNRLSAPFGFSLNDFPVPHFSNLLYIKFLGLFSDDPIRVFNIYYLTTFFLNALGMFWVLRKFRIHVFLSTAISLIFAFLPFHEQRLGHILYTGYFFIPIWIYFLLQLYKKKPLFFSRIDISGYKFDWSRRNKLLISILLLSSTWNFYYTFFLAALIGLTLLSNLILRKSKYHLISTLIFFAISVGPVVINMIPFQVHNIENGRNYLVGHRAPIESELFALKLSALLYPDKGHRLSQFSEFRESYDESLETIYKLIPPYSGAYLGIAGIAGLLISVSAVLIGFKRNNSIIRTISQFNLYLFLLGTLGGIGSIIAYLGIPEIRAYNRVSIFIASASLVVLAIFINEKSRKMHINNFYLMLFSIFLSFLAILDTVTPSSNLRIDQKSKKEFISDQKFILNIEKQFLNTSQEVSIAQLPFIPYPENGPYENMKDYEQFHGYIHSRKIRWSYGVIKGREGDTWWKSFSDKSYQNQIKTLQDAGFSGLLINRNGYKDNGREIEAFISEFLNVKPLISNNEKLSFFKLNPKLKNLQIPPTFIGFYPWEGPRGQFRWAGEGPRILIYNSENKNDSKKLSFEINSLKERMVDIYFNNELIDSFLIVPGRKIYKNYSINVSPGKNIVEFKSDVRAAKPSGKDYRNLSFSIENFNYE